MQWGLTKNSFSNGAAYGDLANDIIWDAAGKIIDALKGSPAEAGLPTIVVNGFSDPAAHALYERVHRSRNRAVRDFGPQCCSAA